MLRECVLDTLGTIATDENYFRDKVKNRKSCARNNVGSNYLLKHSAKKYLVFLRRVRRLLATASVVPSSPILVTLMKEALSSSETSVLTRATLRNIPEDAILHSHRRENLKSYLALTGWAL
jgi:hypothetical protein